MEDPDITQLLNAHSAGKTQYLEKVFDRIYGELKSIANREHRKFGDGNTLEASDLVNEAYLKLVNAKQLNVESKTHFFSIAARAMRQIMINHLESKQAKKRGGEWQKVTFATFADKGTREIETVLSIDKALHALAKYDENLASLVEMRFFAGLSESEIAEFTATSDRTVRRNWRKAKALLQDIIEDDQALP